MLQRNILRQAKIAIYPAVFISSLLGVEIKNTEAHELIGPLGHHVDIPKDISVNCFIDMHDPVIFREIIVNKTRLLRKEKRFSELFDDMPTEKYFVKILGLSVSKGSTFAQVLLRFSTGGFVDHDTIRYGLAKEKIYVDLNLWRCKLTQHPE